MIARKQIGRRQFFSRHGLVACCVALRNVAIITATNNTLECRPFPDANQSSRWAINIYDKSQKCQPFEIGDNCPEIVSEREIIAKHCNRTLSYGTIISHIFIVRVCIVRAAYRLICRDKLSFITK